MAVDPETIRYPKVDSYTYETSIPGIHIIGELTGKPLVKNAINTGYEVMAALDKFITYEGHVGDPDAYDVVIIGAGSAGISAAMEAENRGIKYILLEREKFASRFQNFDSGKPIYAEPLNEDTRGELWFDSCTKEELLDKWEEQLKEFELNIKTGVKVVDIKTQYNDYFRVIDNTGDYYLGKRIVIAIGKSGNPRKIGVSGENFSKVSHYVVNPEKIADEKICIYGGGVSACKAALDLCENNTVTLVTIDKQLKDPKKKIIEAVNKKVKDGKINLYTSTRIKNINEFNCEIEKTDHSERKTIDNSLFYTMIGYERTVDFFKRIGVKLEKTFDIKRIIYLVVSLSLIFSVSAIIFGLFPFSNITKKIKNLRKPVPLIMWTEKSSNIKSKVAILSVNKADREITVIIPDIVNNTGYRVGEKVRFNFCIRGQFKTNSEIDLQMPRAIFKGHVKSVLDIDNEGRRTFTVFLPESDAFVNQVSVYFDRKGYIGVYPYNDPFFYSSALFTLIIVLFGIYGIRKWGLSGKGPKHTYQKWRYISLMAIHVIFFFVLPYYLARNSSMLNLVKAWPLAQDAFKANNSIVKIWALVLAFIALPVFIIWHGKRYCTWICGYGAIAETLGDPFRKLSPKGKKARRLEFIGGIVFVLTVIVTLLFVIFGVKSKFSTIPEILYRFVVIISLSNIIGIGLFPLFGGKIWCRYGCPLGKLMEWISRFYAKIGISKFKILTYDRCIECEECNKYCEVGINVMKYAMNKDEITSKTTSCVGCGICINVCPTDNLAFKCMDKKMRIKELNKRNNHNE